MTSPNHVLAVAEQWRQDRVIYRHADGYVSTQQWAPYTGANDRFGTSRVDHCGIGVANIYAAAGLEWGTDYPTTMQMSTWLAEELLTGGWATPSPEPGGMGVIDWKAAGHGAYWASDHVALLVAYDAPALEVITMECNTEPDGALYYYRRPLAQLTAWGSPRWHHYSPPLASTPATLLIPALAA